MEHESDEPETDQGSAEPDQSEEPTDESVDSGVASPAPRTATGELLKAAASDRNTRAAGGELGKTAYTLAKTVNNVLLPLAAVNYAFDRAREYFENRFPQEIAEKSQDIPPERLIEPKASVAGPALQGLAFSHEEDPLREMYLNLLRASMDSETSAQAHPAFVRMLEQLSAEEVQILDALLRRPAVYQPIAEIVRQHKDREKTVLYRHLMDLRDSDNRNPETNSKLPAMVDNWIRLGVVEVEYGTWLTRDNAYGWIEERPEFLKLKAEHEDETHTVTYTRGFLRLTSLGQQFASVVVHDTTSEKKSRTVS